MKAGKSNGKNKNKDKGAFKEEYNPTLWFEVLVFDALAEDVTTTFGKGSYIDVTGSLSCEGWVSKDGKVGQTMKIFATDIRESPNDKKFANPNKDDDDGGAPF